MKNVSHWMQSLADKAAGYALQQVFTSVYNRLKSVSLSSAGLVIKAGGSTLVKTGASAWYGVASGTLVTKAAATDMPALVGTVVNATFNVFLFTCDSAGTVSVNMGTAAATLGGVTFPKINETDCVIGAIIVNPTGTGNFVGGTTALDDATVVPNVVYLSPIGALDPTAKIA